MATSGTLTIDPWAMTAWVPVTIIGQNSSPKTFIIVLSMPTNATLGTDVATVTIGYDGDIIYRDGFD